ncbi:methyl-accepting chemotaxis protein [Lysinibacillus sp. SGAir0095]|uniref:methyl-accepting chemotaxis protein n=1 Tax=Lysinibacillus sp. SGAir0095 TaxID=2070463 RepID=UPI0010CCBDD9|nr:methyl-accepting chemotaxis protein [Lysinibacillus sp. SGAir0095]QCR33435.1 methyl-accepting chemotaxis protein [Lysinibacillus sp. SGAir0095]
MKKKNLQLRSISRKLMLLITMIILATVVIIGSTSYFVAKNQLLDSGQRELQSIVKGAYSSLELINEEVETGKITLEEGKEHARILLNGPVNENGEYDYQKSRFTYKENGYILAYDEDLVLQLHPTKVGGAPADEQNRSNREKIVAGGKSQNEPDRYVVYSDKQSDGSFKEKTAYTEYFEPWGWTIGIAVFQDEFYEGLNILQYIILGATVVLIILSSLVFYLSIRKKISTLKEVAEASTKIADGHIIVTTLPESSDEIGQLGAAFNKMSQQLRTLVEKTKNTSEHLLDSASNLSAISEETSASSEEVGRAITEIATGTQEQAHDLDKINQTVELLSNSIQTMEKQSKAMYDITKHSEKLSFEGIEIVHQLQQSNTDSLAASQEVSHEIKNLNSKINQITQVMETIETIAEQTNLLALNASIEAARAGEYGRGFSVVADEIRKLAEQSKNATHQVQGVVSSIVSETTKTVETVEGTMKTAKKLNDDVVLTQTKFNQMSDSVKQIAESILAVNKEMDAMSSYNKLMGEGINSASSVSEQTAASVQEIASSIDEQIKAITDVANAAEKLTELNRELNSLMEQYTL